MLPVTRIICNSAIREDVDVSCWCGSKKPLMLDSCVLQLLIFQKSCGFNTFEWRTTFYELCDAERALAEPAAHRLKKTNKKDIIFLLLPVVFFTVFISSNIRRKQCFSMAEKQPHPSKRNVLIDVFPLSKLIFVISICAFSYLMETQLLTGTGMPVVSAIDWTWSGKAHACLYTVPQLTVQVRGQARSQTRCLQTSEAGLLWGRNLQKDTETFLLLWRFQ